MPKFVPSKAFRKIAKATTKAVSAYRMVEPGDKLLIGVSGGNDSMLLMHVMHYLLRRAPFEFTIQAVTVDAGFETFHADVIQNYCHQQGWKHDIIKMDIKNLILEKGNVKHPCSLCARLRRGKLHGYADEHGFNKIVLGHHLDDICTSFLMSAFRGRGVSTMGPNVAADQSGTIDKRIIRPMAYVTKKEIDDCCLEFEFPNAGDCEYGEQLETNGDRAFLNNLIEQLSKSQFTNIRHNMLKSLQNVEEEYLLDHKFLQYGDKS